MSIHPIWRRAGVNVMALGLMAVLLSACMITSTTNLLSPDEAVQPLPASFTMTAYSFADGIYTRSEDAPAAYTANGTAYVDAENSMQVYFFPLADTTYLLDIAGADGAIYGVARLEGDIMEIKVLLSGDLEADLATPPPGVTVADGGIVVADRAALDAMIARIQDGSLPSEPLVAWVGAGATPATIVPDGGWYKAQ